MAFIQFVKSKQFLSVGAAVCALSVASSLVPGNLQEDDPFKNTQLWKQPTQDAPKAEMRSSAESGLLSQDQTTPQPSGLDLSNSLTNDWDNAPDDLLDSQPDDLEAIPNIDSSQLNQSVLEPADDFDSFEPVNAQVLEVAPGDPTLQVPDVDTTQLEPTLDSTQLAIPKLDSPVESSIQSIDSSIQGEQVVQGELIVNSQWIAPLTPAVPNTLPSANVWPSTPYQEFQHNQFAPQNGMGNSTQSVGVYQSIYRPIPVAPMGQYGDPVAVRSLPAMNSQESAVQAVPRQVTSQEEFQFAPVAHQDNFVINAAPGMNQIPFVQGGHVPYCEPEPMELLPPQAVMNQQVASGVVRRHSLFNGRGCRVVQRAKACVGKLASKPCAIASKLSPQRFMSSLHNGTAAVAEFGANAMSNTSNSFKNGYAKLRHFSLVPQGPDSQPAVMPVSHGNRGTISNFVFRGWPESGW